MAKKQEKQVEIKRQTIKSSTIESAGYDEPSRTLEIAFKNGRGQINAVWRYSPITEDAWKAFLNADSQGKYFHANIRDNSTVTSTKVS